MLLADVQWFPCVFEVLLESHGSTVLLMFNVFFPCVFEVLLESRGSTVLSSLVALTSRLMRGAVFTACVLRFLLVSAHFCKCKKSNYLTYQLFKCQKERYTI